ncbi:AI-2E family transporter [Croceicoccus mobilis]|uniref:AI-2E family transporter n=1 Tax=Croceicoccus mobilis TaxID=1703339 RepID=A0A916Z617_9SPHN|nr:AI-2E family transporter [Croceicoccus mobilis]GGD78234.1 AI-2E family transporter [Croceicoccus mobilis]
MSAPIFQPREEDRAYLRRIAYTIAIAALLLVIWRAADLLMLVFGSVLGAVAFRSTAGLFRRAGIRNKSASLSLGILTCLAVIGVMGYLLTVQFGTQLAGMLDNLPGTLATLEAELSRTPVGDAVVRAAQAALAGSTIADRLGSLAAGAGEVALNFLIVLVGAMFIAADTGPYRRGILLLTPAKGRETMARAIDEMSLALRLWLKAKLISMTAMTLLIGFSLWLAGVEHYVALGLLGGLSEFVPYVGPALAMLPSIGIAASQGGDVLTYALIAYVVVRVLEAWLVTPLINREVVSIPPALTLFVILGAGAVFGAYGLFFAGALLVVAFVGVRELYLRDTLGEDVEGVPRPVKEGAA